MVFFPRPGGDGRSCTYSANSFNLPLLFGPTLNRVLPRSRYTFIVTTSGSTACGLELKCVASGVSMSAVPGPKNVVLCLPTYTLTTYTTATT